MRGLYGTAAAPSDINRDVSSNVHSGSKRREPFYYQHSVAIPALGAQATVLQFKVPSGKNGFIWKMAIDYVGAGFTEGSGAITWQIFRDLALRKAVKGFNNLVASVGQVPNPVEIPPIQIYESEFITVVVNNVGGPNPPAGQVSVAAFIGWFYPKNEEDGQRWP